MKRKTLLTVVVSMTAIVLALIGGCTRQQPQEMPITTSSEEALDLFKKGRSLAESYRLREAAQYFEKTIAKDSNFAMAYYHLAFLQPSNDKAFSYLNKAFTLVEKVSQGEKIFLLALQAAAVQGNLSKAKELLEKLVEMYPRDKRVHHTFGSHYYGWGNQQYDNALAEYRRAI